MCDATRDCRHERVEVLRAEQRTYDADYDLATGELQIDWSSGDVDGEIKQIRCNYCQALLPEPPQAKIL